MFLYLFDIPPLSSLVHNHDVTLKQTIVAKGDAKSSRLCKGPHK